MNEDLIEYHPNGCKKYQMSFYDNGNKHSEIFYDMNKKFHRDNNLPAFQSWFPNKIREQITYHSHGKFHNINNPSVIIFSPNGRIRIKSYWRHHFCWTKLTWMNLIKNI